MEPEDTPAMAGMPLKKHSLAVVLSPYKIAKIDALASKLAGRYFHYFAWLVAFTNSSQNN